MNSSTDQIKGMLGKVKKILVMKYGTGCWLCNKDGHDLAHIFGVAWRGTAFDTSYNGNCHILCRECHALDHNAELVTSYADTYKERFGEDKWYELSRKAHCKPSFPSVMLDLRDEELTEELAMLIAKFKLEEVV